MITFIASAITHKQCPLKFSVLENTSTDSKNPVLFVGYGGVNFVFEILPPLGFNTKSMEFLEDFQGTHYSVRTLGELLQIILDDLFDDLSATERINFTAGIIASKFSGV